MLPISHDEVVHGKCSLINKMPGEYRQKFDNLRAFYAYMMAHPGKKLLFMGQEFAQFIEWKYDAPLDWLLLGYDAHKQMQDYVKDLNKFYLKNSQLWEIDYSWEGFSWISNDDYSQSIISFIRKNRVGDEIICVCNFVPVDRSGYRMGVPVAGSYKKLFSSADTKYGGAGGVADTYQSEDTAIHGYENSIALDIPALSVTYYKVPKKRKTNLKNKI